MKIKYVVPESIDEIKLNQYQLFLKLQDEISEKEIDQVSYMIQVINIFVKGDLSKIEKLPVSKLEEIFQTVVNLFQQGESKLFQRVTIKGKEYGMHSNLSDITTSEFADIQEFEKKGFSENLHKILAVLYRPIIQEASGLYRLESYTGLEGRDELFKEHFPCEAVDGSIVFFWTLRNELLQTSHTSLSRRERRKLLRQAEQSNGAGITS